MNKTGNPLLTVRGVACLAIIWFHLRPGSWLSIGGTDLSFLTAPSGTVAVYIFYLLSGYTVGYGFFSKKYLLTIRSLTSFYINRFLRIAPAYYACLLLCIFVFYPYVKTTAYDVVRFFTFTANIDYFSLPYAQLLVIISTEMQFYLVAPVLFLVLNRALQMIQPTLVAGTVLALGAFVRYALAASGMVTDLPSYMQHVYVTVWGMADYFLIGMVISYAVIYKQYAIDRIKTHIPTPVFIMATIAWILWINYGNYFALPWPVYATMHSYILPTTTSVLIGWYLLSTNSGTHYHHQSITTLAAIKYLVHPNTFFIGLGILSYGLYLYHFIFFDLLYRLPNHIGTSMPEFFIRLISVGILTIIAALASFHLIERPSRMKRYKTS